MAAPFTGDPDPAEPAIPSSVPLTWQAPPNGGSPILRYDIIARQDGQTVATGGTDILSDLSYPLNAPAGQSTVYLYAVNAEGRSAPATTTVTGGRGLSPASLRVDPVSGGADLYLAIDAEGADQYYLIVQSPGFQIIKPVQFPYSLRGLTAGSNNRVKVGAEQTTGGFTNAVFSNEVEFIASAGGTTIGNHIPLPAPTAPEVVATRDFNAETVTLTVTSLGFNYARLDVLRDGSTQATSVTLPWTDPGPLFGNRAYSYQLAAYSRDKQTAYSDLAVAAADTTAPPAGNARTYTFDDPAEASDWYGPATTLTVASGALVATPTTAGQYAYAISGAVAGQGQTNHFEFTFTTQSASGGIVWNFLDADNFWACDNTNIIKRVNGNPTTVANVGFFGAVMIEIDPNGDYRLYYDYGDVGPGFSGSMGDSYTSSQVGVWGRTLKVSNAVVPVVNDLG